jgi:hypothetical protein
MLGTLRRMRMVLVFGAIVTLISLGGPPGLAGATAGGGGILQGDAPVAVDYSRGVWNFPNLVFTGTVPTTGTVFTGTIHLTNLSAQLFGSGCDPTGGDVRCAPFLGAFMLPRTGGAFTNTSTFTATDAVNGNTFAGTCGGPNVGDLNATIHLTCQGSLNGGSAAAFQLTSGDVVSDGQHIYSYFLSS